MKKRNIFYYMAFIVAFAAMTSSCQKDNFEPPKDQFTGHLVYKGEPIQVKNTGDGQGAVYFELWQKGFGKSGAINVYLNQDGSFSALLFNGDYQLVIPPAQGPFISLTNEKTNSDTIPVQINGSKSMDIEVLPYYMFGKSAFSIGADSVVKITTSIKQIIKDDRARDIESVNLYVNRTSFVDEDNNIASGGISGGDITDLNSIALTAKVPEDISGGNIGVPDQDYFYARVGIKIAGVEDRIFTEVVKVQM